MAFPRGEEAVQGSVFELDGRLLGALQLDDCYTGLEIGGDGRWHAFVDLEARLSEVWAEAPFAYAMCFHGRLARGSRSQASHCDRAYDVSSQRPSHG